MKAADLKIGNYYEISGHKYNSDHNGIYRMSEDLMMEAFAGLSDNGVFTINAIPLTEEWLLKLGFGKHYTEATEWSIENPSFVIEEGPKGYHFTGGEGIHFSRAIKYVHDLQNLFYALTGEELTIIESKIK